MGTLTDFVLAHRHDATAVAMSRDPVGAFGGWRSKWLHEVELVALWGALAPPRPEGDRALGPLLAARTEEGPWVTEVHPALVARLAALDDDELPGCATVGAARLAEATGSSTAAEDIAEVLRQLRGVARRARDARCALLHWTSL